MCKSAGVKISKLKGGCSIDEVRKLQRVLKDYRIVIYDPNSTRPLYTDERYNGKQPLNIMLCGNHYTAMRSVQACFGARYLCEECHTHTSTRAKHKCKYACSQCLTIPRCEQEKILTFCPDCNRTFFGEKCFTNHLKSRNKKSNSTTCQTKKNCPTCLCRLDVK